MYNKNMNKQDQRIQLVASSEFRQEVDKWRRNQTDIPSHSESIRRLVKIALRLEKGETMKMITAIIRPHKYNDVRDSLITIGIEGLSAKASSLIDFLKLFLKNPMPIPTVNKIKRDESMLEFFIDQPRAKPIKKHPNKFVRRVG